MRDEDARAVHDVSVVTFTDLEARFHEPPSPPPPPDAPLTRYLHLIETDPGGAWVAEEDGRVIGAALAIDRDGVWGLSLLVVLPGHQSSGIGRALFERAREYAGGGRRGAIILASPDHRALRAYARAGFAMHPCMDARGRPKVGEPPPGVRDGDDRDLPLTEAVDRAVRGTVHGSDIAAFLRAGRRLLVVPERGYAVLGPDSIHLLAALDEEAARDLLLAGLAAVPPDKDYRVEWITSAQQWAVRPVLDAGLVLKPGGAIFVRGELGPLTPYLPSGAYL
jgi:GNAT superfamily N-acetyltransferase